MIKTFIIFLSVFLVSNITNASERAPTINVGVYISQPFVMSENNKLTGLAVDLWLGYASKNGLKTIFTEYPTIDALLNLWGKKIKRTERRQLAKDPFRRKSACLYTMWIRFGEAVTIHSSSQNHCALTGPALSAVASKGSVRNSVSSR